MLDNFIRSTQEDLFNEQILTEYKKNLQIFESYVNALPSIEPIYHKKLKHLIASMRNLYPILIPNDLIMVNPNVYTVNDWGKLYWRFMHYTAIVLQYSIFNNKLDNLLDFPLIIYNVDEILPCSICAGHYIGQTKKSTKVRVTIMNLIVHGFIAEGIYLFHREINNSIDHKKINSPKYLLQMYTIEYNTTLVTLKKEKIYTEFQKVPLLFTNDYYSQILILLECSVDFKYTTLLWDTAIMKIYNKSTSSVLAIEEAKETLELVKMIETKGNLEDLVVSIICQFKNSNTLEEFQNSVLKNYVNTKYYSKLFNYTYSEHVLKLYVYNFLKTHNKLIH